LTSLLVQGAVIGLSAAMLPGPFQAFLVAEASRRGWRRTLPLALAPLLSDGPILAVGILALSRVPGMALDALRVAGGAFVLVLAWEAFRALRRGELDDGARRYGGVLRGAVMNLLNPNPWLFWGLVGAPLVLAAWRDRPADAALFLMGFYLTLVAGGMGLVVAFGLAARLGRQLRRALLWTSVLALSAFGVLQVVTGLGRLLA